MTLSVFLLGWHLVYPRRVYFGNTNIVCFLQRREKFFLIYLGNIFHMTSYSFRRSQLRPNATIPFIVS